ncbi:MAG: hypothetical protein KGL39_22345 [Patescibacteria group bacterium]|nr:hypothetical protein [Patescibacteria group bacterium]
MATAAKAKAVKVTKKEKSVVVPAAPAKPSAISQKALLVSVTVHRWKPQVTDEQVSNKVAKDYGADKNVGKYRKRLFAKKTFFDTASIENEIRREYWRYTLPWSDDSGRLLSNEGYMDFKKTMADLIAKFEAEWRKVLPNAQAYEALKTEAKSLFGALYDPKLYPSYEDACHKFGVSVRFRPIPDGADFRVDISDKEADRIRQEINADRDQAIVDAVKEPYRRLAEVIEHMVKRLNGYHVGKDGKVVGKFGKSLVANIEELLGVLPALNITGDATLTEFADQIKKELTAHTVTVLRDDEKVRKSVANKAQEILDKMGAFLS